MTIERDLCIIGGGPAGLCAAINGASEGLTVTLIDSGEPPGGQAVKSSLIENYAGFPKGISGADLMAAFLDQAAKFRTDIRCPETAIGLRPDGNRCVVVTDSGESIASKVVLLSGGLSYKRLNAEGVPRLLGRGVLYGAPTFDPTSLGSCTIGIVGGANSAGQAAAHLSKNPNATIKILVRRPIEDQMSTYLIERLKECGNVEVLVGVEVDRVDGDGKLEKVVLKQVGDGTLSTMPIDHLFIFIGASPKVQWMNGSVSLDQRGFILTGRHLPNDSWKLERPPFSFETSLPGVLACGDIRLGSTKRIAAAAGEGAAALQVVHDYIRLTHET